jgi:glycogen debranching enzyme
MTASPAKKPTMDDRRQEAMAILRHNDRGGYTVPTEGLYPFQWNWDSAFAAMGFATFDEQRGWTELGRLFEGQWADGLVPHIIFHQPSDSYFPGPEVWGTRHNPPTSGITQPPVAAMAALRMYREARDKALADSRARALLPKLAAWHAWWASARDPDGRGAPALLHNWESGMDNSPAWDGPFEQVPATRTDYTRKDTGHVDAAMRPKKADYDRYIHLLETYRACGWHPDAMWKAAPFKVAHIGVNAILLRAELDLAALAGLLGMEEIEAAAEARAARLSAFMRRMWSPSTRAFQSYDLLAGERIKTATSADFLPLLTDVPTEEQADAMAAEIARWRSLGKFGVPTVAPDDKAFDSRRYWRGPVWCVMNWLIADGLQRHGFDAESEAVRRETARLILDHGFAEYFDPVDGSPCGGFGFTWTAAAALAFAFR